MDIHSLIHSKSRKTVTRSDGEWADLDGFSTHHNHIRFGKNNAGEIIWDMFEAPLLLVIVGIMSAATSCLCNTLIDFGNSIRYNILTSTTDYFAWILYCSWCLAFSLLACFVTSTICQDAAGSGLPEMKTILSGVVKPVLLSVRLIFAKMLGLTFSMIAGLSVGKEGPFVQISGAIADQLMRLSIFRHIRAQDSKRLEIIACACASGVGATFGTAFGGVIFSIELTTSAYLVRTVPKAFLSSVCAMLTIYYLNVSDQLALFNDETTFKTQSNVASWQEMSTFLGIGLATGLLGVIFVTFVEQISKFRNKMLDLTKFSKSTVASRRYVMVALVSLIVSIPLYYELVTVPEVSNGSKSLLDHLFQANDMGHILGKLVVYFAYKFAATALSVTLPLPVGLFTPVFLSGGVLGRVVGEILYSNSSFKNFLPWEYAILGAAGFATGVTR
jgi:chloride channel 2